MVTKETPKNLANSKKKTTMSWCHWALPPTPWASTHCHQRSPHQSLAGLMTGSQSPLNSQVAIGTCTVHDPHNQWYWSYFVSPQILSDHNTHIMVTWHDYTIFHCSLSIPTACPCWPRLLCQSWGSWFQAFYMRSLPFPQVCTHLTCLQ